MTRRLDERRRGRSRRGQSPRSRSWRRARTRGSPCLRRSTRWPRRPHCAHSSRQGGLALTEGSGSTCGGPAGKRVEQSTPIKKGRVPSTAWAAHTSRSLSSLSRFATKMPTMYDVSDSNTVRARVESFVGKQACARGTAPHAGSAAAEAYRALERRKRRARVGRRAVGHLRSVGVGCL